MTCASFAMKEYKNEKVELPAKLLRLLGENFKIKRCAFGFDLLLQASFKARTKNVLNKIHIKVFDI